MDDAPKGLAAPGVESEATPRKTLRAEHQLIVAQLAERRIQQGLTQQQVAKKIGITRGQIANAETGKAMLSAESMVGYALAVGARLTVTER